MPTKSIESRHNAAFKLLKDITAGGRVRRAHHAAWLEGSRLCRSYVEAQQGRSNPGSGAISDQTEIREPILVISSESRLDVIDHEIVAACAATWLLDAKLFAEISQVETSAGWGMVVPVSAFAQPITETQVGTKKSAGQGDVVILDRLQDPGNAGSILRSAAASGVTEVWSITGTVDLYAPKVLRAAMGAHFALRITELLSTEAAVLRAADQGLSLLATANSQAAVSLYENRLPLERAVAWVFGQEGDGVSAELLARSQTVVIPQSPRVESLNVAAAASVCLFETMRRKQLV